MKSASFISVITLLALLPARGGDFELKLFPNEAFDCFGVAQANDGGFILVGKSAEEPSRVTLVKLDATGVVKLRSSFPITTADTGQLATSMVTPMWTSDGNLLIIAGIKPENTKSISPLVAAKVSPSGVVIWKKELPPDLDFQWFRQEPSGFDKSTLFLAGFNTTLKSYGGLLAKLDENAQVVFFRTFSRDSVSEIYKVVEGPDGRILAATLKPAGIIQIDPDGYRSGFLPIPGQSSIDVFDAKWTDDGSMILLGNFNPLNPDSSSPFLAKMSRDGRMLWQEVLDPDSAIVDTSRLIFGNIQMSSNGTFILAGRVTKWKKGTPRETEKEFPVLAQADQFGKIINVREWTQWGEGAFAQIESTSDGGYIVEGYLQDLSDAIPPKPIQKAFIVKFGDGIFTSRIRRLSPAMSSRADNNARVLFHSGWESGKDFSSTFMVRGGILDVRGREIVNLRSSAILMLRGAR